MSIEVFATLPFSHLCYLSAGPHPMPNYSYSLHSTAQTAFVFFAPHVRFHPLALSPQGDKETWNPTVWIDIILHCKSQDFWKFNSFGHTKFSIWKINLCRDMFKNFHKNKKNIVVKLWGTKKKKLVPAFHVLRSLIQIVRRFSDILRNHVIAWLHGLCMGLIIYDERHWN